MNAQQANDNRRLDFGVADPDRHRVAAEIGAACAILTAQGIDRNTVARVLLDEMFKLLDGNPFRTGGAEGEIIADREYLFRIVQRVVPMWEQWDKGAMRLRRERRPSYRFNRAARLPLPEPGPRLVAPPADYDPALHRSDLEILKMLPGHVYSERELLVRYRHKMLRALGKRHVDGRDRVKCIAASKKRVLGWMRRTRHLVTSQATASAGV